MTTTEQQLLERDAKRDIWQETLDAVRDIQAGQVGYIETIVLPVIEARHKSGLSQRQFAASEHGKDAVRPRRLSYVT